MTGSSFRKKLNGHSGQKGGCPSPPVIIIGAHRSGTSLITSYLQQAGMFVGTELDPNMESFYFLRLNEWMLSQAGSRWDRPEGFRTVPEQEELRDRMIDQMSNMMRVPSVEEYLGKKPSARSNGLFELTGRWGWKDPRNTITLPVWLSVFPDAKVIHVYRHGVDVAASLVSRSRSILDKWTQKKKIFATDMITDSARCLTLDGAFSLWVHYMEAARSHTLGLGDRVQHVQYERFVENPAEHTKKLTAFCGLTPNPDDLRRITESINADRAYTYRNTKELLRFAAANQSDLEINGFSA